MTPFICKAKKKRKDVNETIEGILLPNLKRFNGKSFIISDYTRMQDFENAVEIDTSTLTISFDGGESWYDDLQLVYETLETHYPKGI